jgi:hypothetical protein
MDKELSFQKQGIRGFQGFFPFHADHEELQASFISQVSPMAFSARVVLVPAATFSCLLVLAIKKPS